MIYIEADLGARAIPIFRCRATLLFHTTFRRFSRVWD